MDEIWYEKKLIEYGKVRRQIQTSLKELKLSDEDFNEIMRELFCYPTDAISELDVIYAKYCSEDNFYEDYNVYEKWKITSNIDNLINKYEKINTLKRYLDNDPMEFDGDILITDPCYVIKDEDWRDCHCGEDMWLIGIDHFMTRDTIYGDWSCTTFDSDTKEPIGRFCADAGLVSIMLLDEVLKYNPDYDCNKETEYAATIIRDFKGTVQFVVKHIDGYYEDTTDYHQKGDYWEEYYLEIVGHGINKVSGKPINFIGKQSGF